MTACEPRYMIADPSPSKQIIFFDCCAFAIPKAIEGNVP